MSKVASFCIYGPYQKYWQGAVENAKLYRKLLPDWTPRFYFPFSDCPDYYMEKMMEAGGDLHPLNADREAAWLPNQMFYRFLALLDPEVDRFLIRDTDSRLSEREVWAIREWEKSEIPFHRIHDHPLHLEPIMGGMWGGTSKFLSAPKLAIEYWFRRSFEAGRFIKTYGNDQEFLKWYVLPLMGQHGVLSHCSPSAGFSKKLASHEKVFFPGAESDDFVGEIFDENNQPNEIHRAMRHADRKSLPKN